MNAFIEINRLVLRARHGVMAPERDLGQRFNLDIVLELDIGAAIAGDQVKDTVSYAEAIAVASEAFTGKTLNLIETAAARVGQALLDAFPTIIAVKVRVEKPSAPVEAIFDDVAVRLEMRR